MRILWRDNRVRIIILLAFLATVIGVQHNRAVQRGSADPFAEAVMVVIAPVQSALRATGNFLSDFGYGVIHGRRLQIQNQRFKQQLEALQYERFKTEELRQENERLRRYLHYTQKNRPPSLTARVIAIQPSAYFHTLILGSGRSQGVQPRMVAVTDKGLVGLVYLVTQHTAHVLLITDPNASVGGRIQRTDSRVVGVCQGRGENEILLTFLPKDADVRVGDVVITSGLGGVFPAGIPIGAVEEVIEQRQSGMREARVKPFVEAARVEEVLLYRHEEIPR